MSSISSKDYANQPVQYLEEILRAESAILSTQYSDWSYLKQYKLEHNVCPILGNEMGANYLYLLSVL
jgi:hypothetical protein